MSPSNGMKWSENHTPSHPVASACWADDTISVHGWPAPGQNENRITGPSTGR